MLQPSEDLIQLAVHQCSAGAAQAPTGLFQLPGKYICIHVHRTPFLWQDKAQVSENAIPGPPGGEPRRVAQRDYTRSGLTVDSSAPSQPETVEADTDIHQRLCALLDREGADYRVVEHQAEGRTELVARIRGNRPDQAIKSIVVQVRLGKKENRYCLANVPGDCRIDLEAIKGHFKAAGIGMARRERAEELTGCVMGAIPPFSFNDQLTVLADPRIEDNPEVVFNAGRLDRSIFMKSDDYMRIAKPEIVRIGIRA
jgi:Ala-tRNA(Pro) deacylase